MKSSRRKRGTEKKRRANHISTPSSMSQHYHTPSSLIQRKTVSLLCDWIVPEVTSAQHSRRTDTLTAVEVHWALAKLKTQPPREILMTSQTSPIVLKFTTADSPDVWLTGRRSCSVTLQPSSWAVLAVGNELQERSEVEIAKWLKCCAVPSEFLDGKDKKPEGRKPPKTYF